jgi:transglutaminase-like putative cysteine protease
MDALRLTDAPDAYRAPSKLIDYGHPLVQAVRADHPRRGRSDIALAEEIYLFVRDEIPHSWDIQAHEVPARASEVLTYRHGICYAKSHLLAALLRAHSIPAGICYQRLVLFEDPADGYSVHALNAVYLDDHWIRLDARGNKPGVDAQFSLGKERLAFPVRPELDERDYPEIRAFPHPDVVKSLLDNTDCLTMYLTRLPASLDA